MDQYGLMCCFKDLIDAQIRTKSYADAMKTCKKIKLFNLHSQNSYDVIESLESSGYKELLPETLNSNDFFKNYPGREEYKLQRLTNKFEDESIYDKFSMVGQIALTLGYPQ